MTWRSGPVAITGVSGQMGRALAMRLAGQPNELRALDRAADVRAAFRDAEVVVHLAGTLRPRRPSTYRAANLDTVLATVEALAGSTVRRVVFLSFIAAQPAASNPYLRYKAEAEEALRASGVPTAILRCGHIYGPPEDPGPTASAFLARKGRVRLLGSGAQRLTPVYRGDVVDAIVRAALDPAVKADTFELVGPQTFTAEQFARRLNPPGVKISITPNALARLLPLVVPALPAALVDVLLHDAVSTGDPAETAERLGVHLHALEEVWRR